MPVWETGVAYRSISFRQMFNSIESAIKDINKYKNFSNVYHTIYSFRETEEKYDIMSDRLIRTGPNYETADMERIVLDLDCYKKEDGLEYFLQEGHESMFRMEDWADKLNLEREYRFTGGGFNFIFSSSGEPLKLRDFELWLINEHKIDIDPATVGDVARMMRVTNSYNFKNYRQCYCIPLTQEEIYLPYEKIKRLAENPRFGKRFSYGKNSYSFSHHKIDEMKVELRKLKIKLKDTYEANEILENYGWKIEDFCDSIKSILSKKHVGNHLRYEILKYFKSVVRIEYVDALKLMIALLGGEGRHSAMETQARFVFGRERVFNPAKLKGLGYCPKDCNKCMNIRFLDSKLNKLINGENDGKN